MELGPEDVSLLERYPLIRGPDMSLLEMCPHFRVLCTGFSGVGA